MGKVAVVTGGTRGIGAEISKELQAQGYHVIASYLSNDEKAKAFSTATSIETKKWDVSDFQSCQKATQDILKVYGRIDVLINNAGMTRDKFLHKMDIADWDKVIATNLTSVFNMTHSVIQNMRDRQSGRIISISSINGQKGQLGQSNYAAAKAGIIGFTKSVAQENAKKGITVNTIAPGYIATDMLNSVSDSILSDITSQIPVGRLGESEDIAKCVAYLVSDEASFITGSTISINGGQIMI